MDTVAQDRISQDIGDVVVQTRNMTDVPEETLSMQTQGSLIASSSGVSNTYPYRMLLKDISFPRFHLMARPGNRADTFNGSLRMLGHGTPLWEPIGNLDRPKAQLNSGISIGDVGFLNNTGDFETYFNLFLPPDHPAQYRTPPKFKPLDPPLDSEMAVNQMHFSPGTVLMSKGIEATSLSSSTLDIKFTVNAREGGILVLPDGASREDLLSTTSIQSYVQDHALDLYLLAKRLVGDMVVHPNGTLYVITGTDKASTWANCTTHSPRTRVDRRWTPSEIIYQGAKENSPHQWCYEKETRKKLAYKTSTEEYEDVGRCALFIRGMRIALNIPDWTEYLLQYKTPGVATFSLIRTVPILGLRAKIQTFKERLPGYRQTIPAEGGVGMRVIFHPLDIILRLLIEESPSTTIAYIEDHIWCAVADKSDASLTSIVRLLVQILETHESFIEDGRITLVPLKTNPQKHALHTSPNLLRQLTTYIKQKYCARSQRRKALDRLAKVFPGPRVPTDLLSSCW